MQFCIPSTVFSVPLKFDHPRVSSFDTCISFFLGLDCEQSPSFFRFSGGSARAHKRRAAEPRDERNQGGASPVSRLQSRAWSFSCLAQHVGISLRKCFTRSSLFLSKSIKIIIVCLVYRIFLFFSHSIPQSNQTSY